MSDSKLQPTKRSEVIVVRRGKEELLDLDELSNEEFRKELANVRRRANQRQ